MIKANRTTNSSLKESVLKDARVVKLFRAKESGTYAVNTQELMNELQDLMQTRKFRSINTTDFMAQEQRKAIDWLLELNAYRSRAVSIKMNIFKIKRQLDEQLKNTKGFILNTYSVEIASNYSSITAKNSFVDHLLEPLHKISFKFDSVLQMSDLLIGDLDQSYWIVKGVIEVMKIKYNGKE